MKSLLQITKQLSLGLSIAAIMACAHKPNRIEYPETVSATQKAQELQGRFDAAKTQQVDVLAAKDFKKAERTFNDGQEYLKKDDKQPKALKEFGMAEAYLNKAVAEAEQIRVHVQGPLKARELALSARAYETEGKKLAKIDSDFYDLNEELIEGDKVDAEELVKIEKQYFDLQGLSINQSSLVEAHGLLRQAKQNDADSYAPRTFSLAEARVKSAENAISAQRMNPEVISQQSAEATAAARKAVEVTALAKGVKGLGANREQVALQMWERDQQLKATTASLSTSQAEAEALKNSNATLSSEVGALGARTRQLQTDADWNAAIADAQKQFTKDEAEVYRQGDQLLIRLKNIQFSSNKAEVPSRAMPTLKKVSDIIANLEAEKVVVEGHTDSVGSAEINKSLSEKRADSVKSFLASAGSVQDGEIETIGYGFDKPLTSNKTKEGRATNRRVDILVIP